ncbi:MAG: SDR family oxidoreductase [Planctomycetes bacterium]|nr:SDR family oxidoreductase [Planctomycetota bacterium]
MEVTDKVCVVTGASRGIGLGVARIFRERGMKVAGCARSEPQDPLDLFRSVDVTDLDAVERFRDETVEALGPIDLWVNNAGVLAPIGMTRDADPAAWRRLMDVNVVGVYHGARAYLRSLRATGRAGCLINVGSGASTSAYAGWGPYCASKAAVDQLTRVLAYEESDTETRVFCLAPGVVETGMQEYIRGQDAADFPMVDRFRQMHADGKLLDVAVPAEAMLKLAFGPARGDGEVCLDVRTLG